MARLSDGDYTLSMKISRRRRDGTERPGLRSLLVHRLWPGPKAVYRVPLSDKGHSVYCEPCDRWTSLPDAEDPPVEWKCGNCARQYVIEFGVYALADDEAT